MSNNYRMIDIEAEKRREKRNAYYKKNQTKLLEKSKQYKQMKNKTKINCGCGETIKYTSLTNHFKTIKHQNFLKEL
jgi:hypothetical protein